MLLYLFSYLFSCEYSSRSEVEAQGFQMIFVFLCLCQDQCHLQEKTFWMVLVVDQLREARPDECLSLFQGFG